MSARLRNGILVLLALVLGSGIAWLVLNRHAASHGAALDVASKVFNDAEVARTTATESPVTLTPPVAPDAAAQDSALNTERQAIAPDPEEVPGIPTMRIALQLKSVEGIELGGLNILARSWTGFQREFVTDDQGRGEVLVEVDSDVELIVTGFGDGWLDDDVLRNWGYATRQARASNAELGEARLPVFEVVAPLQVVLTPKSCVVMFVPGPDVRALMQANHSEASIAAIQWSCRRTSTGRDEMEAFGVAGNYFAVPSLWPMLASFRVGHDSAIGFWRGDLKFGQVLRIEASLQDMQLVKIGVEGIPRGYPLPIGYTLWEGSVPGSTAYLDAPIEFEMGDQPTSIWMPAGITNPFSASMSTGNLRMQMVSAAGNQAMFTLYGQTSLRLRPSQALVWLQVLDAKGQLSDQQYTLDLRGQQVDAGPNSDSFGSPPLWDIDGAGGWDWPWEAATRSVATLVGNQGLVSRAALEQTEGVGVADARDPQPERLMHPQFLTLASDRFGLVLDKGEQERRSRVLIGALEDWLDLESARSGSELDLFVDMHLNVPNLRIERIAASGARVTNENVWFSKQRAPAGVERAWESHSATLVSNLMPGKYAVVWEASGVARTQAIVDVGAGETLDLTGDRWLIDVLRGERSGWEAKAAPDALRPDAFRIGEQVIKLNAQGPFESWTLRAEGAERVRVVDVRIEGQWISAGGELVGAWDALRLIPRTAD